MVAVGSKPKPLRSSSASTIPLLAQLRQRSLLGTVLFPAGKEPKGDCLELDLHTASGLEIICLPRVKNSTCEISKNPRINDLASV